jgi:hypothetical protein
MLDIPIIEFSVHVLCRLQLQHAQEVAQARAVRFRDGL